MVQIRGGGMAPATWKPRPDRRVVESAAAAARWVRPLALVAEDAAESSPLGSSRPTTDFTSPVGGDANLHLELLHFTSLGDGYEFFLHLHHIVEVCFWVSKMKKLVNFCNGDFFLRCYIVEGSAQICLDSFLKAKKP